MTHSKKVRIISSERIKQLKNLLLKLNIDPPKEEESSQQFQRYYSLIDEALTHTSAEMTVNHERLEFLGDAVLRLAATEFIDENFSSMNVGDRSALRAHLVSDQWLSRVGSSIQIKQILLLGNKAQKDFFASATLEAEATEALIGAVFENIKDLEIIKNWLIPYWIETSREVLSDPHKKNPKSALQEWSQSKNLGLPEYITIEKLK